MSELLLHFQKSRETRRNRTANGMLSQSSRIYKYALLLLGIL
jgi:hypothetical protein